MSTSRGPASRILGTGHYAPAKVLTNGELERMVDTSDAWISERTGIRERRIAANGELTSDMASAAARSALEAAVKRALHKDVASGALMRPSSCLCVNWRSFSLMCKKFQLLKSSPFSSLP